MLLGVGEDSVVGLEVVLLEELLITVLRSEMFDEGTHPTSNHLASRRASIDLPNALDVQERVLETEQFVASLGSHCV